MAALVEKFSKIGTSESNLDTESAIQFAIQETKVGYMTHTKSKIVNLRY